MLSKRLHDALNAQINAELWSAYLVEGNKCGLYTLDKELAARVYQQASPLATATE